MNHGSPVHVAGGRAPGTDVRMLELGGEEDFAAESLRDGNAREQFRREHLDDDVAVECSLTCDVGAGHPRRRPNSRSKM